MDDYSALFCVESIEDFFTPIQIVGKRPASPQQKKLILDTPSSLLVTPPGYQYSYKRPKIGGEQLSTLEAAEVLLSLIEPFVHTTPDSPLGLLSPEPQRLSQINYTNTLSTSSSTPPLEAVTEEEEDDGAFRVEKVGLLQDLSDMARAFPLGSRPFIIHLGRYLRAESRVNKYDLAHIFNMMSSTNDFYSCVEDTGCSIYDCPLQVIFLFNIFKIMYIPYKLGKLHIVDMSVLCIYIFYCLFGYSPTYIAEPLLRHTFQLTSQKLLVREATPAIWCTDLPKFYMTILRQTEEAKQQLYTLKSELFEY